MDSGGVEELKEGGSGEEEEEVGEEEEEEEGKEGELSAQAVDVSDQSAEPSKEEWNPLIVRRCLLQLRLLRLPFISSFPDPLTPSPRTPHSFTTHPLTPHTFTTHPLTPHPSLLHHSPPHPAPLHHSPPHALTPHLLTPHPLTPSPPHHPLSLSKSISPSFFHVIVPSGLTAPLSPPRTSTSISSVPSMA